MSGLVAIFARNASAGPWNIEPRLGASVDYTTNPGLSQFDTVAEQHAAILFNLPLRYDADAVEFSLTPSGRLSNANGYSSLASNYAHVVAQAQVANETGSMSLQGQYTRDSSLYHAGELVNGVGVRRDTAVIAADWVQSLSERNQLQLDASWSKVRYDQHTEVTYLVDYRYLSAGPTFSTALDERNTLKVFATYGNYQSLDGITESTSESLQLGWVGQLTELWTLSASAGYSHAVNTVKFYFGPFYLGNASAAQNGTVYAVNVTREGEKFKFNGGYTQALQPTGYAYLSHENALTFNETYVHSERWDFSLGANWQKIKNPAYVGGESTVHYLNAQLTANWHWTALWTLSMRVVRVTQEYGPPAVSAASSGVSLDIVRQFLRTEL
jgi:hypothetical protein